MKRRSLGLWPLLPALFACAVEEIAFVTSLPLESQDDGGPGSGSACGGMEDCEPGEVCERASCDSVVGLCRRPAPSDQCGAALDPVCGCDGVTYFNDCLRQARGIAVATPGACLRGARFCGVSGTEPCPTGLSCARLFPLAAGAGLLSLAACLPQLPGVCWVLPQSCDAEPGDDVWISCDGEASSGCVDTCSAIRSELPHVPTSSCP